MSCNRSDIQSTFQELCWFSWGLISQDNCNKSEWWTNSRFCEVRCHQEGLDYGINCTAEGSYREGHVCGVQQELMPLSSAETRCAEIGMHICDRQGGRDVPKRQHRRTEIDACGYNSVGSRVWTLETCAVNISVDANGKVASHHTEKSRMNKVSVIWSDGAVDVRACPAPCVQDVGSCVCPMLGV